MQQENNNGDSEKDKEKDNPQEKSNPRKKSTSSKQEKQSKVITWDCQDGCGTTNTRKIAATFIVNDDVCDYCGKTYHEPVTLTVLGDITTELAKPRSRKVRTRKSTSKKVADPVKKKTGTSKKKLPKRKKTDSPEEKTQDNTETEI